MNPIFDQVAVVLIVVAALVFLIVRSLRKRASGKSCGSDCACGSSAEKKQGR